MAAKKRNRNLPTKKSKKAVQSLFPGAKTSSFQVGPYPINDNLDFFSRASYMEKIYLQCATAIIAVFLLCQIRSLKPASKPPEVDRLPCFKFYKKMLLSDTPGFVFAFALAVSNPAVIVEIPDVDMEVWLISIFNTFQGNEKRLQSVNSSNVSDFICGEMSRILGILNSTPANNFALLGINELQISNFTISDCLAQIGYDPISSIKPSDIIENIRFQCNFKLDDEGNLISSPITFNEPPLSEPGSVDGGTIIEREIFGLTTPVRTIKASINVSASTDVPTIYSPEVYEPNLSFEQAQKYKAAVYIKKYELINKLNPIIEKAIASKGIQTSSPSS